MFSYEIFCKNELVASGSGFMNYTEMCIEIGGIVQENPNSSKRKNGFKILVFENGKRI